MGAVNTTGQTWLIITVVCGFVGWQKIMNRFLKKYFFHGNDASFEIIVPRFPSHENYISLSLGAN